jgi:hypothetical protein
LTTTGGCTFTSSTGQWYGIEFFSAPGGSTLYGATIQNAQFGVYVYNSSVSISHNTIQYNASGIYANNFWSGVTWNLIQQNYHGVRCESYGDVNLTPNNVLRLNSWGVHGDASSAQYLGSGTGYNSLYWNDYYDIYSSYGGTIQARGNWWGDYPPYPSVTANVDYANALTGDPNPLAKGAVAKTDVSLPAGTRVVSGEDTLGLGEFDHYRLLLLDGEETAAQSGFESLVSRYPNTLAGVKGLVFAQRLRESQGADPAALLNAVAAEQKGAVVGEEARLLMTGVLLRSGDAKGALLTTEGLMESQRKDVRKNALYQAGNICWYWMGDESAGKVYFETLAREFSGDPLSISALATLGVEYREDVSPQKSAGGGDPVQFTLDAYPNPFNPSTTIRYSIPVQSAVKLTLFNVLGQQVAVLDAGEREAGYHEVRFEATGLASGVYLYRLQAGNAVEAKKLLLSR